MLVIRLQRVGKKNQPFFRLVLAEKTAPIKGKFIEKLGFLNTIKKEKRINAERVKYWIGRGAQPSDSVYNILVEEKILKGKKRFVKIKKKKEKKKEAKESKEGVKKEEKTETGGKEVKELKNEIKNEEKTKKEEDEEKPSSEKPKIKENKENKK